VGAREGGREGGGEGGTEGARVGVWEGREGDFVKLRGLIRYTLRGRGAREGGGVGGELVVAKEEEDDASSTVGGVERAREGRREGEGVAEVMGKARRAGGKER